MLLKKVILNMCTGKGRSAFSEKWKFALMKTYLRCTLWHFKATYNHILELPNTRMILDLKMISWKLMIHGCVSSNNPSNQISFGRSSAFYIFFISIYVLLLIFKTPSFSAFPKKVRGSWSKRSSSVIKWEKNS